MDYRTYICDDFANRRSKNRSYSLRAYARTLGVSPATLCGVLNGKRNLHKDTAKHILDKMPLSPEDRDRFMTSVAGIDETKMKTADSETLPYEQFPTDKFQSIAHWYHLVILALAAKRCFPAEVTELAKTLCISKLEAKNALDRLMRLSLLQINDGVLIKTTPPFIVQSQVPSSAIRSYHQQNLELASRSIDEHDVTLRDMSAIVFNMDAKKIDEARGLIREFREKMAHLLTDNSAATPTYTLAIHLFPVATPESK